MFIAMNRFQVIKEAADDFETMWRERESHLGEMKGFVEFHMLRGPSSDDHILYASHTVWAAKSDFEVWTVSEQFRRSHARAPATKPLYLGHPHFEGFEVIQTVSRQHGQAAA